MVMQFNPKQILEIISLKLKKFSYRCYSNENVVVEQKVVRSLRQCAPQRPIAELRLLLRLTPYLGQILCSTSRRFLLIIPRTRNIPGDSMRRTSPEITTLMNFKSPGFTPKPIFNHNHQMPLYIFLYFLYQPIES